MQSVDTKVEKNIAKLIINLYEFGQEGETVTLSLSKAALKSLRLLQDELYADIDNTDNNALRDYYGKYKEHVLKIAGLFQIVRHLTENADNMEISKETFDMAIVVAEYYQSVSANLFADINADKPIDTEKGYQELLKRCKEGIFNPTFLNAGGIGGCDARKKEYTDSFIQRLIDLNRCIEIFHHGGKGRKFILIKE